MRTIRGLALGTYFAAGAPAAKESPNATPMRGLVYAVKNNRVRPNPPQPVAHSRHPAAPRSIMVDRDNALDYVAAIVAKHLSRICARLDIDQATTALVPIPSSSVTRDTILSDRWPALRLATRFEAVGLGTATVVAVNRRPRPGKTSGGAKLTVEGILGNLERVKRIGSATPILLIDDVITSGRRAAALDLLLKQPARINVLVVGMTVSEPIPDCYDPCIFEVRYPEEAAVVMPTVTRRTR